MSTLVRDYQANEVIFRQGEPGRCAYIIESGRVQVSVRKDGEDLPLTTLGEGEIFGEMAIIDRLPRSATATALEPTRLCVISQDTLTERVQNADPVVRLLMMMMIRRTRNMNLAAGGAGESRRGLVQEISVLAKEAVDQVRFESEVKLAFTQKEFRLNYQPIVLLSTGEAVGYEALIRWHSPSLGVVPPNKFMGIIEESSLMIPVGRWIAEQAMDDLVELQKLNGPHVFMSINVSPRQLVDPNFLKHLETTRQKCGLRADLIKLEITEQIFVQGATIVALIEQCRKLGYKISLDDFGTGYSSISYLKEMALDVLKIDQSFVRSVQTDEKSKSITQVVASLAAVLGLDCVAEGIESEEAAQILRGMGCAYGQGYHFGKPQPLDYYLKQASLKPMRKAA